MLANSRFNTRLDVYSRKCVPELCKLTRDKNPKVTVEAIKALKLITSCSPRMMSNINLESTFLLVFCNQPTVATEAAWLICESFMKTSEGDTVTFLSAVIKFLHSSEVSLNCSCTAVFLEIMLPKAGFYLSNWKAWITLLTGDMYQGTPDLAVNACQLFTSVVRYTATGSLTSKVFLSIDEHFHSETVAQAFVASPGKSTCKASAELEISRRSVQRMLKQLKFKPYRPSLLQALHEDDSGR
ncbi:hypothetical protein J6590_095626 [Homalodisca vitripennis]|nr:hypothetical protein J6590_094436 [Homalodisca vitripennis]KAG8265396.1 hypothetical protein J6590_095626 [Homalodisca vitripennis]